MIGCAARRAARRAARTAALRLVGAVALLGGLLALAAAIWLALAAVHGHVTAAASVGGLAVLAGLVMLAWPISGRPAAPPVEAREPPPARDRDPLLVDGFLIGLAAAAALRGKGE